MKGRLAIETEEVEVCQISGRSLSEWWSNFVRVMKNKLLYD